MLTQITGAVSTLKGVPSPSASVAAAANTAVPVRKLDRQLEMRAEIMGRPWRVCVADGVPVTQDNLDYSPLYRKELSSLPRRRGAHL